MPPSNPVFKQIRVMPLITFRHLVFMDFDVELNEEDAAAGGTGLCW